MSRLLYIIRLDETIVPDEGVDIEEYYNQRAGSAVGTLQTNVRYVKDQISLLAEAINLLYTDLDIIAYAVGTAGDDVFQTMIGIQQSASGAYALGLSEIIE